MATLQIEAITERPWHPTDRVRKWALGIVALVGLAARVGLVAYQGLSVAPVPGTDASEYDAYAWNLTQGNGYRGPSPDVADQNHLTAYRPPLPSLLLAGVYAVVGHRYDAVRLVHCLLGAVSIVLVYRIGRRAYGDSVGLRAAAGYALYPLAILQSTDIASEPLGVLLFLCFLDQSLQFAASRTWGSAITAGIVFGLALLTRANYALMVPLFALWAVVQLRGDSRHLLRAGAVLAVAGLVMAPWMIRNYLVFERFIPFSTTGGSALLQGNNRLVVSDPRFYGYSVWDTELEEYQGPLRTAGDEVERDRRAKELAVQWLKEHRDQWGFLLLHKFLRSWTPWLEHNPSAVSRVVYLITWGPILILFGIGVVPSFVASMRAGSPAWLMHLAILHYVLNSLIFFANIRYRAPVDPLCLIIAAWTITQVLGWRQSRCSVGYAG